MRRSHGFTLLELMVVIAILGVLAALLLSAMQAMKEESASTRCLNNLRQWGVALNLYANDNGGFLPRRGQGVQLVTQIDRPTDWFNALPPYLGLPSYQDLVNQGKRLKPGDESVFVCPRSKDPGATNFLPYAMNMYLSPWIRPNSHSLQELESPSQLAFLADAPGGYSSTIPSTQAFSVIARHRGRANICFVDGHAGSFDGDRIGCGKGDPHLPDLRWETLTDGVNQAALP